jgi:hypothetical protein
MRLMRNLLGDKNNTLADIETFETKKTSEEDGLLSCPENNRAKAFAPHENLGPAISEAAKPRCVTPSAINLPDTTRWSEARPR